MKKCRKFENMIGFAPNFLTAAEWLRNLLGSSGDLFQSVQELIVWLAMR